MEPNLSVMNSSMISYTLFICGHASVRNITSEFTTTNSLNVSCPAITARTEFLFFVRDICKSSFLLYQSTISDNSQIRNSLPPRLHQNSASYPFQPVLSLSQLFVFVLSSSSHGSGRQMIGKKQFNTLSVSVTK